MKAGIQLEFDFDRRKDDAPFVENPQNDNDRLLRFQWEYRHGKAEALSGFYELAREVCVKFIKAQVKHSKKLEALSFADIEEKAHNAASYVVTQLLTREDFALKKSATGYLFLRVRHELFYKRKVDGIISLFSDLQRDGGE